jgi:hypothetical protein
MKPFHPLADIFPLMEGDTFDELAGDMQRRGFRPQFPIVTFEDQIIDGRNRARAADKASVEPNYTEFQGKAEDIERFIIQANIHRRHLTTSQRRELLKKLLKLTPEQSDRSLGRMTKFDNKTVAIERRQLEATEEIPQLKKIVGKDGKARKRPAKKKRTKIPEQQTAAKATSKQSNSRTARWIAAANAAIEALGELRDLQAEYQDWRDGLPENLQNSPVAEKLDAVCDVDIESARAIVEEAGAVDLPLGFGRD